jgi:putative ABC transport system permease protein
MQFLVESILFSALSFIIGFLIAIVLLPFFNTLSAKSLSMPWSEWWLLPLMAMTAIIVGIISGLYPAFYLSAFKPIQVLKGHISKGSKRSLLRNGLVVFQFATSIILIVSTLVIYSQSKYILTKKTGFNKDQVVLIQGTNTLQDKTDPFKEELEQLSQVNSVSIGDYLPIVDTKRDQNPFWKEGKTKEDVSIGAQKWRVDHDYIKTMGIKLIEGREFSKDIHSDSAATIINRSMAVQLGLKDPLGKIVENGWEKFTVIGVVEDFNFELMNQDIGPLCMILGNNRASIVSVKIKGANASDALASISSIWKSFSPNQPFRYTFMDESFANMYTDVQHTARIFTSFAVFAILVACLGLFALSAFMAEQRTKEIGIRKVLGASSTGIVAMLSGNFVKLIILSIIIASPIAWWAMTVWLQDFAYKITIGWWFFVISGLAALLIALLTVSFQAIRAALTNPVKSLRAE